MIEDREIWACAQQLLRQHGPDAWFIASQRADALLAQGEIEGAYDVSAHSRPNP
jgi:hypothetical protein